MGGEERRSVRVCVRERNIQNGKGEICHQIQHVNLVMSHRLERSSTTH